MGVPRTALLAAILILVAAGLVALSQPVWGTRAADGGAVTIAPSPLPAPPPSDGLADGLTRSDVGEGGAKVLVTWLSAEYLRARPNEAAELDPERYLLFRVVADSPSLKMSAWDLKGMIYLREESGREYGTPIWRPTEEGTRKAGTAAFPRKDGRGNPVPAPGSRYFEIVIRDLVGVRERVFRWSLGP